MTINPSPQSSPLPKGRSGSMHAETNGWLDSLGLGSPMPANSRRFTHEIRISDYLRRILRG